MTQDQLRRLDGRKPLDRFVPLTAATFGDNFEDRTLLYGYDCDRKTWHLFTSEGNVYLHVYDGVEKATIKRANLTNDAPLRSELQMSLIPNKRLYPERCDYDFCLWARMEGLHLPFTTYDVGRMTPNDQGYYGEI